MKMILHGLLMLLSMILVILPANAAPQVVDNLQGSKVTAVSYIEDNSNANVTLVSAATGQSVTLYKYVMSVSTADNIYFKCGTSQKMAKVYLAANGGLDNSLFPFYLRCASGEALTLVKGNASTPLGITFWFLQTP